MFSLIISLIAIALVALLAGATAYFGGSAFTEGGAKSEVARYTNGAQQVQASSALYVSEFQKLPGTVADLVDAEYLAEEPWPKGAWQFANGFVEAPGHMAQASCETLMKRVSDGTIPETRQAGLHEQCYGAEVPYTYAYMAASISGPAFESGGGLAGLGGQWTLSMGASNRDIIHHITSAEDGIVAAGYTETDAGDWDGWLVKFDFDGNRVWSRTLRGSNNDYLLALTPLIDGFVASGRTQSSGAGSDDGWLAKFDSDGNRVWSRTLGGWNTDLFYALTPVADGFIAVGQTSSAGAGSIDGWVAKFDSDGNRVWSRTLGGGDSDVFYDVTLYSDGIVAAGRTKSVGAGNLDGWVAKFDFDGNRVWSRTLGGSYNDSFQAITSVSDGFVAVGSTVLSSSGGDAGWLVKFDADGNRIWSRTLGGSGTDYIRAITSVADGLVVTGHTNSAGAGGLDGWMAKLDFEGNQVWSRTLGSANRDQFIDVITVANSVIGAGITYNTDGDPDGWLATLSDAPIDGCANWVRDWPASQSDTPSWSSVAWNPTVDTSPLGAVNGPASESTQEWDANLLWHRTDDGDTLVCQ